MPAKICLVALADVPDFRAGDDLAAALGEAFAPHAPEAGDILCVAQKVFSKVEGCVIPLASVTPGPEAQDYADRLNKDPRKVQVVLDQSRRVVRAFKHPHAREGTLICQHKLGFTSANAAVDESNFEEEDAVMVLPPDPDRSASDLAEALSARFSAHIGVVMTDTFGRPWRLGQVNVAIGIGGGVPATQKLEGGLDAWGRPLTVTEPALADELAAAAGLAMGKSAKTPAILVRGVAWTPSESSAQDLVRQDKEDMFQ
jgi:coenzyme F420-0:L-glutamate ligase/coenzyme F420-1:gamma-L-glutamate ligase